MIPFLAQFDNYLLGIVTPLPGASRHFQQKGLSQERILSNQRFVSIAKKCHYITYDVWSVKASYIDRIARR